MSTSDINDPSKLEEDKRKAEAEQIKAQQADEAERRQAAYADYLRRVTPWRETHGQDALRHVLGLSM
jgi:hypothetical protein